MKQFRNLLICLLVASLGPGHVAFAAEDCSIVKAECDAVIQAFEETVDAQDLQIEKYGELVQDQDLIIKNLREQRDEAIKSSGSSLLDVIPWFLVGAAAATVVIGIRR